MQVACLESTLEKERGQRRVGHRENQVTKPQESLDPSCGEAVEQILSSELTCLRLQWPGLISPASQNPGSGCPVRMWGGMCASELEGADRWRPLAGHTPCSWATSLSLKGKLHSTALDPWDVFQRQRNSTYVFKCVEADI